MQKILRILLLGAENSARGLQEIGRDFQRIPGRAARADPSVRRRRRLAERALHAPAPTPQSHLGGPALCCSGMIARQLFAGAIPGGPGRLSGYVQGPARAPL
eukprot:SAG25_NODE_201_length_11995_cov_74.743695_5_plen_102_part_00